MASIAASYQDVTATGEITCFIKRSNVPNDIYAISCRHLFSLSDRIHPTNPAGDVRIERSGFVIGETTGIKGKLHDSVLFSLDAELAKVTDTTAARALCHHGTSSAKSPREVPIGGRCRIHTGRGAIWGTVEENQVRVPFTYGRHGIQNVLHRSLILISLPTEKTERGDSGAPVFLHPRDSTPYLIGMHIGLRNGYQSVVIPSWHILAPGLYQHVSTREIWSLHPI